MARLRIPATKSNLIRLKEQLELAQEGQKLLSQKREVLVRELMELEALAEQARQEFEASLAEAYRSFGMAAMLDGFDHMERLALAVPTATLPETQERSVMGVVLPLLAQPKPELPRYGIMHGSAESDRTVRLFHEVLPKLLKVAELETAMVRLATETRKTLCRERALENLFVPQYRETVHFIQESLEEKEREAFYQLKLIKSGREH